MQKSLYLICTILAVFALVGTGCSCGQKLAEKAVEKAVESSTNNDVDFDFSDDTFSYTTDEGESMQWGEDAELPDNFPADVPVYQNADVTSSSYSQEDDYYSATLTSADDYDSVNSYYESELSKQGWTVDDTYDFSDSDGQSASYSASKDDRSLTVGIYEFEDEISITLSVGKSTL